jgi:hypothetical protein
MSRTACTEPQFFYKGELYLFLYLNFVFLGNKSGKFTSVFTLKESGYYYILKRVNFRPAYFWECDSKPAGQ